MYSIRKTSTGCKEPVIQNKTKKSQKQEKRRVKTCKNNYIGVPVSNKGVNTDQMIMRVVSVTRKDNVTKTNDGKGKIRILKAERRL